jgi:hypothetical protein
MRSSRLFFGTLLVIVISTTYVFVGKATLGPRFRVTNDSTQIVVVTAHWRDQIRDLGAIEPDTTISLTVRDEASMVFSVKYADGSKMKSEPISFTAGTTTHVSISQGSIDVTQDFDT